MGSVARHGGRVNVQTSIQPFRCALEAFGPGNPKCNVISAG